MEKSTASNFFARSVTCANKGPRSTIMCHLILMLPVVALPLFWFLPLTTAGPLYGAATTMAGVVYYYAWETGRRPVKIGRERLCDTKGSVVATQPVLRVKMDGEIWRARSPEMLAPGDEVRVVDFKGLVLRVAKTSHGASEVRLWKA